MRHAATGGARAPEIDRPGLTWFNTSRPLSLGDLAGRIVILDFWTFCCINCMHVLPTLRQVEDLFPDEVAVIGVHSPKFAAERDSANLLQAIARYDIRHPVVHDPDMILWRDYGIGAWPTLVFLSTDGHVIAQAAGEPDPGALLDGIGGILAQTRRDKTRTGGGDDLTPGALPLTPPAAAGGRLCFPGKIKFCPDEKDGPLWAVADAGHHQIVLFDDAGRERIRFGSGSPGFADGPAGQASFRSPQGLVCDDRSIWVADTGNHALRRIDRNSGAVATVAGTGRRGSVLLGVRPAGTTALASPWDVETLGDSLLFANAGSHQIGRLSLTDGSVSPLAGNGGEDIADGAAPDALLAQPSGLALDDALYFVDAETSSVRMLSLGRAPRVTTLVGTGLFDFGHRNGNFERALLQHPLGIAVRGRVLYVADSYNGLVRRLDLDRREVEDVDLGECADPLCLPAGEPAGIAVAGRDRLLLSDTNNHRIVEIARGRNRTWAV